MRAKTIKAGRYGVAGVIGYYAGLAADQARRDGACRGPIDYYIDPAEPPGRWWGSGRAALGLGAEVAPAELEAILVARHPVSDERLGKGFGDRSARAYDATFSAPKSVSLLWALSDDPFTRAEVLAAHDAAVEAALAWFERHGAVTRRGTDGVHQVDTDGVAVAVFRQHTSRSADPQLHTHALVMAKVTDPAGEWLSLDARFLKAQQGSIGWVYAAALRSELTARLGVAWGEVTDGHADIVGVPAELMKVFSTRSAQVKARMGELVADWTADHDGAEPDPRTLYRLQRRAALDSRPAKQAVGEADALRADWRVQAAAAGMGSIDLPTTAPELPGMAAIDRPAIVAEALARVAAQSSTWLHADLSREIATVLPSGAAASATDLVELVDELTVVAAAQCVELQPERPGYASLVLRLGNRLRRRAVAHAVSEGRDPPVQRARGWCVAVAPLISRQSRGGAPWRRSAGSKVAAGRPATATPREPCTPARSRPRRRRPAGPRRWRRI
ncbi:MAG: MobF family relaxase [Nocardioidaceae bacterium]